MANLLPVVSVSAESSDNSSPYVAWKHYLPAEKYSETDRAMAEKLSAAEKFVEEHSPTSNLEELHDKRCFAMDPRKMRDDAGLAKVWPTMWDDFEADGETVLGVFGLAKHQVRRSGWLSV
jgi:hypothetical protein